MRPTHELQAILEALHRGDRDAPLRAQTFVEEHTMRDVLAVLPEEGAPAGPGTRGRHPLLSLLPEGHFLGQLYAEHEVVLDQLDWLGTLVALPSTSRERALQVLDVLRRLSGITPHLLCEECVLFPRLRSAGLDGVVTMMVLEHDRVRALEHAASSHGRRYLTGEDPEDWAVLRDTARELVVQLGEHVQRENDVLLPLALDTLRDADTWDDMALEAAELLGRIFPDQ